VEKIIKDDLDDLLAVFPSGLQEILRKQEDLHELLEIVLDLGRPVEARFPRRELQLSNKDVTSKDIEHVVANIGSFGEDNRAGIERTLHRISAIRNRQGTIVGLTCRVGRAVYGTIKIIEDLIESGKSVMLLGRPGVGKTTMLREVARVLADEFKKRVIIVDTSNEIAGDGDIPHPAIGHSRRMQVTTPNMQHSVMIEAVENHMPEIIVIDEIGTELEAQAARTIAERGVQLVGTAHGNTLENLMMNPTLSDLIGGIQSVTLGDEEAKRRGSQKSILERKSSPTFDIVVEIQGWDKVSIHPDVGQSVDDTLRNRPMTVETRWLDEDGGLKVEKTVPAKQTRKSERTPVQAQTQTQKHIIEVPLSRHKLFLFGVNKGRFEQVSREIHLEVEIVDDLKDANLFVTSKSHYRRKPQKVKDAESANLPIYVLRSNTPVQIKQFLHSIYPAANGQRDEEMTDTFQVALGEAQEAVNLVKSGKGEVELSPQSAYIRRLQHLVAERNELMSLSTGKEPGRKVMIFKE